jgi:hypothetical protein
MVRAGVRDSGGSAVACEPGCFTEFCRDSLRYAVKHPHSLRLDVGLRNDIVFMTAIATAPIVIIIIINVSFVRDGGRGGAVAVGASGGASQI